MHVCIYIYCELNSIARGLNKCWKQDINHIVVKCFQQGNQFRLWKADPVQTRANHDADLFSCDLVRVHCPKYCIVTLTSNIL